MQADAQRNGYVPIKSVLAMPVRVLVICISVISLLLKAIPKLLMLMRNDLGRWQAHFEARLLRSTPFERVMRYERQPITFTETIPQEALPPGWLVYCEPSSRRCYYVSPEGEASWTPPAELASWTPPRSSEGASGLGSTGVPEVALSEEHMNKWTRYCSMSRAPELKRRADVAILKSERKVKWKEYCAFPQQKAVRGTNVGGESDEGGDEGADAEGADAAEEAGAEEAGVAEEAASGRS